ncbi:hypothetical protein [Reyranella sp.]|uniref:hypothetical protein n=1 Tax=Reyranella sp. TaxID=1929291 RepID=UPI00378523AB
MSAVHVPPPASPGSQRLNTRRAGLPALLEAMDRPVPTRRAAHCGAGQAGHGKGV